jgi:TolA-binding protein
MTEGQTLHFEAASEARREPAPRDFRKQSAAVRATQTQAPSASRQPTKQQTVPPVDDEKAADELLASADWARQSHDVDGAIAILSHFMERYPADRRVGVAAFTLGKLTLRSDPGGAARWFQLALDRGVPRMMAEGVAARLVEALAKVGDVEAARTARQRYDVTYPRGVHRDEVAQWAP